MENETQAAAAAEKAGWGPGPWQDEPDEIAWHDEATGLACMIRRNHLGSLCGYVGVPAGHPWHGKGYLDIEADVHGGLTYARSCREGPGGEAICRVPASGGPGPLYWLGFDCGHIWDIAPGLEAIARRQGWVPIRMPDATYKTVAYVRAECARLAGQAAAAAVR